MNLRKIVEKYNLLSVQVKAAFWFLICSFLQKGISVVTTPIFTRLISPEEYGQYSVFNSWYGIISIFVSLNLSYGVYAQGLIKYQDDRDAFSSSLQGLTFTLAIIWTVVYYLFRNLWNSIFSLRTDQMACMMIMIWTSAVFSFWATEQRVNYAYQRLVIITILTSVAMPALEILLLLHMQDKVTARILGITIVQILSYTWMFIAQVKNGKLSQIGKYWRYAFAYNIPLIPHYLSQIVLNNSDRIMISSIVGDFEAGIYSLAYSVALIMTLFNSALLQTITPWLYQKIKEKRETEIAPVAYITLSLIGCVNIILILFAPEVVAFFAPNSYHEAIWVIPPVAMSAYFMYSYDLFAKFAFYYEKTKFVMVASIIGAALNIVLNFIFIHAYGYIAAGYTTLVCYALYAGMHYLFMRKVCRTFCDNRYPYDTKIIVGIMLVFMGIGFLLLLTYAYPVIRYGIAVAILILCFMKRDYLLRVAQRIWSLRKTPIV